MTVLSAAQSAAIRLLGQKPTSLFSATSGFALELADLASDVAVEISKAYDWEALTQLATFAGDGTTTRFGTGTLPYYDRMVLKSDIHSLLWKGAIYYKARDLDEWEYLTQTLATGTPGAWIKQGTFFNFFPAPPLSEQMRFYYVTNIISTGTDVRAFTGDNDQFLLEERLLTLGLIWRWRAQKRLEYAEDLKNYELALEKAIAKDKGSKVLTVGRRRAPGSADLALPYPGRLGP